MTSNYFVIEALKGSTTRFCEDPLSKRFVYRRTGFENFPAFYGFVESYDELGKLITNQKDDLDFFLISNKEFFVGAAIKEKDVSKVVTFKCIDTDTNEQDDKLIVILNDEKHTITQKGLCWVIDSITAFFSKKSNFVIKGMEFHGETPLFIKEMYETVDWSDRLVNAKTHNLKNPSSYLS